MDKIFWTQVRDNDYEFSKVHASMQDKVKALAKADVEAGVIDADRYEELIGEAYEAA